MVPSPWDDDQLCAWRSAVIVRSVGDLGPLGLESSFPASRRLQTLGAHSVGDLYESIVLPCVWLNHHTTVEASPDVSFLRVPSRHALHGRAK